MIGLALVTLVATLAAGIVTSFEGAVNDLFTGDYAITAQNNFSPIPIDAAEAAAQAPGVTAIGNVRTGEVLRLRRPDLRDRGRPGHGATSSTLTGRRARRRSSPTLGEDGVFVDDGYADDQGLALGSPRRGDVPERHEQARSSSRGSSIRRPADRRSAR